MGVRQGRSEGRDESYCFPYGESLSEGERSWRTFPYPLVAESNTRLGVGQGSSGLRASPEPAQHLESRPSGRSYFRPV